MSRGDVTKYSERGKRKEMIQGITKGQMECSSLTDWKKSKGKKVRERRVMQKYN